MYLVKGHSRNQIPMRSCLMGLLRPFLVGDAIGIDTDGQTFVWSQKLLAWLQKDSGQSFYEQHGTRPRGGLSKRLPLVSVAVVLSLD